MADRIDRRQYVRLVAGAIAIGTAGCSEPSDEGEPPAGEDGNPPEGPVEDQNGHTGQEPGMGPADPNETLKDNDTHPVEREGEDENENEDETPTDG